MEKISLSDLIHILCRPGPCAKGGRLKHLIVNADDFGMCRGVNTGIVDGYHQGIIRSTTLMANGDDFEDAVARAKEATGLGVGCHLVLLGGHPVAPPASVRSLLDAQGLFPNDFGVFTRKLMAGRLKYSEIVTEFRAQIERILNTGIRLTHLDSHKHSHAHPTVLDAVLEVAETYRIPAIRKPFECFWWAPLATLRAGSKLTLLKQKASRAAMSHYGRTFRSKVARHAIGVPDQFYGFMHTGPLTPELVATLIARLPDGVSELMCHPAHMDESLRQYKTRLKESRVNELETMTSPLVREAIQTQNIQLVNFSIFQ